MPTGIITPHTKFMPFIDWVRKAQIKLKGGEPYGFAGHEYLRQICLDNSPEQVFEKGAQVAISTLVLIKSLYVAEHMGLKALYFFQDDAAVSDFSNDRCLPMLEASPYLKKRIGGINNVGLKRIKDGGALYFRGLYSRGKAKSVDGDMVVLDEVAEMNDANKQLARDRVMHSKLQWIYSLSQPDIPGADIDLEFSFTDQHYWHLICPSCGFKDNVLELDFPENILPISRNATVYFPEGATHYRGCKKCQARLDMSKGIWVPHQPSKRKRGYHLSQLYTSILPPGAPNYATHIWEEYLEAKKAQSKLSRFTISILGYPYGGGAAKITDELLDSREGSHGWSYSEVGAFMGVDQGDTLTIAIGIRSGQLFLFTYFEETERWSRLDELMEQFAIQFAIVDALPNKYPAKEFVSKWKGRAAIQYFTGKELKKQTELHEGRVEVDTISQDRTECLDAFVEKLTSGQVYFPRRSLCSGEPLSVLEDVRRHLKKLTVKYEVGNNGIAKRVYTSGPNIQNHFGMACNSATIAGYEFGMQAKPMVMPVFRKRVA